jgi:hypothetical protein
LGHRRAARAVDNRADGVYIRARPQPARRSHHLVACGRRARCSRRLGRAPDASRGSAGAVLASARGGGRGPGRGRGPPAGARRAQRGLPVTAGHRGGHRRHGLSVRARRWRPAARPRERRQPDRPAASCSAGAGRRARGPALRGQKLSHLGDEDLLEEIPDQRLRAKVVAEVRPQPRQFWTEALPAIPAGWTRRVDISSSAPTMRQPLLERGSRDGDIGTSAADTSRCSCGPLTSPTRSSS